MYVDNIGSVLITNLQNVLNKTSDGSVSNTGPTWLPGEDANANTGSTRKIGPTGSIGNTGPTGRTGWTGCTV